MKQLLLGAALVGTGIIIGAVSSNDTVKCLSPASSYNHPAGGARFFRCISASRDRETDAVTLYFH